MLNIYNRLNSTIYLELESKRCAPRHRPYQPDINGRFPLELGKHYLVYLHCRRQDGKDWTFPTLSEEVPCIG